MKIMWKRVTLPREERIAKAKRHCRKVLVWTVGLYVLAVPVMYYENIIFSFLPRVFFELSPLLLVMKFGTAIYTVYVAIRYARLAKYWSVYPLLVVCYFVWVYIGSDPWRTDADSYFSFYREEREQFVKDVCEKKIHLKNGRYTREFYIPQEYMHLSLRCEFVDIICEENRQTGIYFLGSGMFYAIDTMYRSDDSIPEKSERILPVMFKVETNWFYLKP